MTPVFINEGSEGRSSGDWGSPQVVINLFLLVTGNLVMIGTLLYVFGSCERHSRPTNTGVYPFETDTTLLCFVQVNVILDLQIQVFIPLRPIPLFSMFLVHVNVILDLQIQVFIPLDRYHSPLFLVHVNVILDLQIQVFIL